jgi:hypothetical protein
MGPEISCLSISCHLHVIHHLISCKNSIVLPISVSLAPSFSFLVLILSKDDAFFMNVLVQYRRGFWAVGILVSSQTLGVCLDFLNHREGGMIFILSPVQCTLPLLWE